MSSIIKIIEVADGVPTNWDGKYLVDYDNAVEDDYGYGKVTVSENVAEAKVFTHASDAFKFWQQQSRTIPLRPDGRPNRPLTAFTIEVAPLDKIE